MKIKDLQPIIAMLDMIEPTVEFGTRKLSKPEIEAIIQKDGDKLGNFRTKFKPSECLQIIETREKYQAMIEAAQLEGKDEV
jgi:hypothetical protein